MSGVLFMRPYSPPHIAHIIKMADETRGPTTPVPVTDDLELWNPLKPSTIYMVRICLVFSVVNTGNVWRPACTAAVDFAALFAHRQVGTGSNELWLSPSSSDHWGDAIDTTRFNTPFSIVAAAGGGRSMIGMIKTSVNGGTFSIQWGGGNLARTMEAGSFMYLKEAEAY